MYLSIRTTIFWNILVLMVLAVALISVVVFRITEGAMLKQHGRSGEILFSSIEASLSRILEQNPALISAPSAHSELQNLFLHFVEKGICRQIFFVDNNQTVIAHSEKSKLGRFLPDKDIMATVRLKTLYKKIEQTPSATGPQLVIAGPVDVKGKQVGFLKVVCPLDEIKQRITGTTKIIFTYILFDAVILIAFGTFLLSRYLTAPIKRLIRLTEDISESSLDGTPIYFSGKNEFGRLSSALKTMSEKLNAEKAKIQEQFNALEEKTRQLQQAQKEIIQSEKLASIGRLAAGIAHEIGNPAGIILGYIHMLKSSDLSAEERKDYLDRMGAESERLNTIIRDLLDYAQPSSREIEKINLNDLITSTYSLVSYQKELKEVKPVFNLADGLPPLYANEKQIRQLALNLVLNARDAMPGGGTLTFTTRLDKSEQEEKIVFIVADTGEGISPENREKVFDPFFTTKEQGKGTGLGLSNVHRIVELSGATMNFISTPGGGTTFTIRFPVIKKNRAKQV